MVTISGASNRGAKGQSKKTAERSPEEGASGVPRKPEVKRAEKNPKNSCRARFGFFGSSCGNIPLPKTSLEAKNNF